MSESTMTQLYCGSVKTVYQDNKNAEINYFSFSDDYSIFDWGKMPDSISNKGKALSIMGGFLFKSLSDKTQWKNLIQTTPLNDFDKAYLKKLFNSHVFHQLCEQGLSHHFLGWTDTEGQPLGQINLSDSLGSPLMRVNAIQIHHPTILTLDEQPLYSYAPPQRQKPFLIPLEVVFRFGMPKGSSLSKRLVQNPNYAAELGLSKTPRDNALFERPVVEYFTKLEPTDRFVSRQEALLLSGLSAAEFETLHTTTQCVALWLYNTCAQHGIQLWDGKFEFAWTEGGLQLVDSIGPDELRLTYQGVQLSKELLRQVYRETPTLSGWVEAVQQAKIQALPLPGIRWQDFCREELGQTPRPLPAEWRTAIANVYGALTNTLVGDTVIPGVPTLDDTARIIREQLSGVTA